MAARGLTRIAVVVFLLVLALPCIAEDWFGPPVVTTTPYNLEMVRAADLDHDGLSDVIVQVVDGDSLVAYRADRNGQITWMTAVGDFGSIGTHQEYAFYDFFADGQVDLVLNNGWGQLDLDVYQNGHFFNDL